MLEISPPQFYLTLVSGNITAAFNAQHVSITPGQEDVWINVHPFDLVNMDSFPEFSFEITPNLDAVTVNQENKKIVLSKEAFQYETNYTVSVSVFQEENCTLECTFTSAIQFATS